MTPKTVLIETPETRVELSLHFVTLTVVIEGQLNEDVLLASVTRYIEALEKRTQPIKTVEFDLGKVKKMNSCGIREWLDFLEKASMNRKTRFLDLSEVFVELASMIRNLLGKTVPEVLEFQAPYFCEKCDLRHTVTLKPNEILKTNQGLTAPEQRCPTCLAPMNFDSIESEYFAFLRPLKRDSNARK